MGHDYFSYQMDHSRVADKPLEERRLWRTVARILILPLVLLLCSLLGFAWWLVEEKVFVGLNDDITKIMTDLQPDRTVIFDGSGEEIAVVYRQHHVFVAFEGIPASMRQAILAAEDQRFFSHPGFDLRAIARAVQAAVQSGSFYRQGGSTITQQVVRRLTLSQEKTIARKLREIALAYKLEGALTKEKILEIYANRMFLGNGSYGIAAAAERYFGKELRELDLHEIAMIAGLFQLPSLHAPTADLAKATQRAHYVLDRMYALKFIEKHEWQAARSASYILAPYSPSRGTKSPYVVDAVLAEMEVLLAAKDLDRGLRIHTNIDLAVQRIVEKVALDAEPQLQRYDRAIFVQSPTGKTSATTGRAEVAILAVRPHSGEIVGFVGGRDYSGSQFNRALQAQRAPGSAFKPLVYTLALQEGYKWSDVFLVAPINIDGYRPRDLQDDYLTETTMLRAFYRSINTPAIELGLKMGLDKLMGLAKEMGIQASLKREVGTVIGSSAVSLLDMARMYGVFASGGKSLTPQLIDKITDNLGKVLWQAPSEKPKQAIDEKIAGLMLEGLRAVLRYGTGSRSSHLAPFAVGKSGTSDQSIDNWFCGFSRDLVLITWVGSEDHSPAYGDISGSVTALPIWTEVMNAYFKQFPPSPFEETTGLVSRQIDPMFGFEVEKGGAQAWFLNGQLPVRQTHLKEMSYLRSGGGRFRHVYSH